MRKTSQIIKQFNNKIFCQKSIQGHYNQYKNKAQSINYRLPPNILVLKSLKYPYDLMLQNHIVTTVLVLICIHVKIIRKTYKF